MSKKKINKENVVSVLNRIGDSVTMDTDKKSSEPSFPQFSPGSLRGLDRQADHKLSNVPSKQRANSILGFVHRRTAPGPVKSLFLLLGPGHI